MRHTYLIFRNNYECHSTLWNYHANIYTCYSHSFLDGFEKNSFLATEYVSIDFLHGLA